MHFNLLFDLQLQATTGLVFAAVCHVLCIVVFCYKHSKQQYVVKTNID